MTLAHPSHGIPDIRSAVEDQRRFAEGFFDELAAISTDPAGGITRDTYGAGENRGHEVMRRAADADGFAVTVDAAGNTYARWPQIAGAPDVIMGSHLDSVPRGGNFDGAAGPLAALVAMRALRAIGAVPRVTLCAMGIRAEESVWFQTSYIGSRAALGTLPRDTYDTARRIDTGRTLADHMAECGCDVDALRQGARALDPAAIAAYVEVHIEQAPSLLRGGKPLGICTAVPGNFRYPDLRIVGVHGHVGTPRRFRNDAAMAGARLAMEMDRVWSDSEAAGKPMGVTFGRFHTDAGFHGLTTVPGLFHLSVDVRAYDPDTLAGAEAAFLAIIARIEAEHGVRVDLGARKSAPVGLADADIRGALHAAAKAVDVDAVDLGSPASHDAAAFAAAGVPMAMLFVRNANGSHNPDEAMEIDDFMEGCAVLTRWLYDTYCR
ncbi:hydantoinase/carbamoylase family amidase [Falsirhodobacter halotolerans]|uniref:hydantoinase/carbamoylase family amidase n=1 Tax=Falsirhodobacter halotolerans TaxID=1146892 RepID=UPI001FD00AA9|nr:hydantoinase/carbamoylase family amidase [Falsirhodobacter halotolerans]MCJ8140854.1 hydantoinase/carbamoylase family amidase [Falsirhodobacter halotolerans]